MRKGSLNASIAHELRTPLNVIIGFAGTLLMRLPGPITPDQENQLKIIQSSARELLSRINTYVDEAGTPSVDPSVSQSAQSCEKRANRGTIAKLRVLVVEDHPNSRRLMAYLLESLGFEAMMTENGEEGLALARERLPDLILCDVELPNIDGYEMARQVKSDPALRCVPFVALTAAPVGSEDPRFGHKEFDYYLAKPIRSETFASQVRSFLAGGALTQFPLPDGAS